MLARVANNIYWFGRYVERAENTARLIGVHANLLFDLPRKVEFGWAPLIAITGSEESFRAWYQDTDEASVLRFLLTDPDNPDSILSALAVARESLRTTRDVFPREAWEQLNDLYLYVRDTGDKPLQRRGRQVFTERVIRGTQHLAGLLGNTMSRGDGFNFLRVGVNLERADMITRIIDIRSETLLPQQNNELAPFQNIQWMSVLRSLSGYQMYRQHVRLRVSGPHVLRFLLQNREFPRAVHFCLDKIESCLKRLPRHEECLSAVDKVQATVEQADVAALVTTGLNEFIDRLQQDIHELDGRIGATYFHVE